jgi:hypothetical protein
MDLRDQTVSGSQPAHRSPSVPEQPCAHCVERTYLKTLVAELLYKNQVLRFDLQDAQERLDRAERDHSKALLRTNWLQQL